MGTQITKNIGKNGEKWWKNEEKNTKMIVYLAIKMANNTSQWPYFWILFGQLFALKITPPKFMIETKKDDGCIQTWCRFGYLAVTVTRRE